MIRDVEFYIDDLREKFPDHLKNIYNKGLRSIYISHACENIINENPELSNYEWALKSSHLMDSEIKGDTWLYESPYWEAVHIVVKEKNLI